MADPDLDPDNLAASEFTRARRGWDPTEVGVRLNEAADALRAARQREDDLRVEVDRLTALIPPDSELEQVREQARLEGTADAREEARELVADAEESAATETERGKAEGRRLVEEAQLVRRRILEDLARRRRSLRVQIEQLGAGRERLLEAYEVVGHTLEEATQELDAALPEARAAAERAGRRRVPAQSVEEIEAEIDAARLAGLPIVERPEDPDEEVAARAVDEPDREDLAEPVSPRPVVTIDATDDFDIMPRPAPVEGVVPAVDEDGAGGPSDEADRDDDEGGDDDVVDQGPVAGDEGDEAVGDDAVDGPVVDDGDEISGGNEDDEMSDGDDRADGADGDDAAGEAGELDLFARIRRETDAATPESAATDEPVEDASGELAPDASGEPVEDSTGEPVEDSSGEPVEDSSGEPAPADGFAAREPAPAPTDEADAVPVGALGSVTAHEASDLVPDSVEGAVADFESIVPPGRGEVIEAGVAALARQLKRELADEQNQALDRIRRSRRRNLDLADVLDPLEQRIAHLAGAAETHLADVADQGAPGHADPAALAVDCGTDLAQASAAVIDDACEQVGDDRDELARAVRTAYRAWNLPRLTADVAVVVEAAYDGPDDTA